MPMHELDVETVTTVLLAVVIFVLCVIVAVKVTQIYVLRQVQKEIKDGFDRVAKAVDDC